MEGKDGYVARAAMSGYLSPLHVVEPKAVSIGKCTDRCSVTVHDNVQVIEASTAAMPANESFW